jgi:hypothetical protein
VLLRLFVILLLAAVTIGGAWFAVHELYIRPEERLKADKMLPPPAPPPDPSVIEFERCLEIRKTKPASEARIVFEQFLREFPLSTKRDAAYDVLGEINAAAFFSAPRTEANTYVVKSGDSLARVSARTKVPMELLVHLNRLEGRYLHPNQRLLAPQCSFRMVIQQKAQRVVLYDGDKFFRQYPATVWPAGHGKQGIAPRQTGRVTEKRAFDDTGGVTTAQFRYYAAQHMIIVNIPGHSLYTQPDDPKAIVQRPPGGGIGMSPAFMSEISVLLPAGAPVSIE